MDLLLETKQYNKPTGRQNLEATRKDGMTSYNPVFKQF
jgi:hypothetical protein